MRDNYRDWHVKEDGTQFEVECILDYDEDWQDSDARYLVEYWTYRGFGHFEEHKTFSDEDSAVTYVKKRVQKRGGRYRILVSPEGHLFDPVGV